MLEYVEVLQWVEQWYGGNVSTSSLCLSLKSFNDKIKFSYGCATRRESSGWWTILSCATCNESSCFGRQKYNDMNTSEDQLNLIMKHNRRTSVTL